MGFHLRKLGDSSPDSSPPDLCDDCNDDCPVACPKLCLLGCHQDASHSKLPTKYLIIISTLLTCTFLIVCFYVYYVRCYKRRSDARRRSSQREEMTEIHDEYLDEDHGPVVDHHIWYINTVGLQPSIINSIAVCKYVKGAGLVEGTECSVCLTEFEEDETLRLLPKCSHAFHVPCIDTWLRSHTNCPMCRAPIVSNMADKGPSSSSEVNNGVTEGTRVVIMEGHEESESETEGRDDELAVENEGNTGENSGLEDGVVQPVRRSVSLDSRAASEFCQALANGGNLHDELGKGKESSLRTEPKRAATGNQGLLRLMCHSSIGRSLQNRPNFMKRSFSCNGEFTLPITNNNNNENPHPPL